MPACGDVDRIARRGDALVLLDSTRSRQTHLVDLGEVVCEHLLHPTLLLRLLLQSVQELHDESTN